MGLRSENGISFVIGVGRCSECGRLALSRSYDRLCIECLVQDRDMHKINHEEGSELLDEATFAFAGLAGEGLDPCIRPCVGHLREGARKLYRRGLDRFIANSRKEPRCQTTTS